LRENAYFPDTGIDAVAESEINYPVFAAEGHGRFGPVDSERVQPLALSPRKHDCKHVSNGLSRTIFFHC
jgi:hypothetical protein